MEEDILTYVTGVAHIGIAVPDIYEAIKFYKLLGFKEKSSEVVIEQIQKVKAFMMENNGVIVELLAPIDSDKESPLDNYLLTKPYKIYHIAYYVSDFDRQVELLKKNRFQKLSFGDISKVSNGNRTIFMSNRRFGIVELVERI